MTQDQGKNSGEAAFSAASAALPLSLSQLRVVSQQLLAARLEPVKVLRQEENETYRLMKDSQTGEHYLHYAVRHLNLAAGGAEEEYHHLMPVAHDEVISFALGAQDFVYPDDWKQAYLRNGPEGGFVWYDPDGAADESAHYDEIAAQIRAKLEAFRAEGRHGAEETQRLMEEMDRLFRHKNDEDPPTE